MRRLWKRFGAIYMFGFLWITFALIHGLFEYLTAEPSDDWRQEWARSTFENLQSEMFQVAAAAIVIEVLRNRKRWFTAADEE